MHIVSSNWSTLQPIIHDCSMLCLHTYDQLPLDQWLVTDSHVIC